MAHRSGESRQQAALFPVMLDELVSPDAVVRVIDAWIGALPLTELGFAKSIPQRMGAPPYDPADLLRLYLWGYLNAVPDPQLRRETPPSLAAQTAAGAARVQPNIHNQ